MFKSTPPHFGPVLISAALLVTGCAQTNVPVVPDFHHYVLDYRSKTDPSLQAQVETIDATIRQRHGMTPQSTAVGLLDLQQLRLALIRPDEMDYAASLPKIGILLAYVQIHSDSGRPLDDQTRHELGLMAKASSNEAAARFSRQLGLKRIQEVLNSHGFYDAARGGGIWIGKHYGRGDERHPDPVGNFSHAATVRQLIRYFLMMEQGTLVSPGASKVMRDTFASPDILHDQHKFVKGLAGRQVEILRKWGSWEDWRHDVAVIQGPGRHYILAAMTRHANGDSYLVELAAAVDDLMTGRPVASPADP